jgi:hypothetical protein
MSSLKWSRRRRALFACVFGLCMLLAGCKKELYGYCQLKRIGLRRHPLLGYLGLADVNPQTDLCPGGHPNSSGYGHFKLLHLPVRAKQAIAADRAM